MWGWFRRLWRRGQERPALLTVLRPPVPTQPVRKEAPVFGLVAAPWIGAASPESADPEAVRTWLSKRLYEELDSRPSRADREFLERLLRVVGTEKLDFPPFPDIARRLDRLLGQGDPSMFQVVRLVEQDPSLVRRVWIQASSAGFSHPPSGLHHAIARIGFDALWRIGMSICLHSAVFRVRGYQEEADHARSHGVTCAELAAWITQDKRGEVFLAGLLHDIGKLVVYRAACVRDEVDRARPRLVHRLATELHAGIGLLAVHAWQLPDRVAAAVGFHHDPDKAPEEAQEQARVLWITDVAFHTADQARLGRECGGLAALQGVEDMDFDAAQLMEKAHALLVEMEAIEEAAKA